MMKKTLFLLSFLIVFFVSCSNSTSSRHKGTVTPADSSDSSYTGEEAEHPDSGNSAETSEQTDSGNDTAPEESSEKPDADGNSEDPQQNDEPAAEKFCQYACETDSDCVQGGASAINDEDNYKCENRKCVYLGCLSDAECDEVYSAVTQATGRVYRCNKNGAYGYPECTPVCSDAADCNLYGDGSTQYAYDLDNNKCENGFCVYTGCNSDAECEASTYSSDYKCIEQDYSGKTLKICNIPCKTAADCANSVYPEGYYECRNSQCIAKSCESDEWCAENVNKNFSCL